MSDLRDQLVKAITEVYLKAPAVPKVADVADAVEHLLAQEWILGYAKGQKDTEAEYDLRPDE